MPGPAYPFTVPAALTGSATVVVVGEVGTTWDLALDGEGYMLSTLDEQSPFEMRSYAIQAIQKQKPRIDQSEEPGEQTLESWWARAQHSWHAGAGQAVLDSEFSSRFGFRQSFGLDLFSEKGQATLLKDTLLLDNGSVGDYHILAWENVLFMSENGLVWKIPDLDDHPTSSTSSTVGGPGAGSGVVEDMTTDGKYLYVTWGAASGIRRQALAAWSGDTLVNDLDPTIIEFAKHRLMAAKGTSLYEIIDLTDTTEPDPIFTHSFENWIWTSISEAGPAIYASGYSDDLSDIYGIRLTVDDLAAGATLGAPVSRWRAPDGEKIYALKGFSGSALLIGTSKGLRIGVISTGEGDLDVSPLLTEHEEPVWGFALDSDYAYFSWGHFDSTYSGIGRIDLGERVYHSDLMYADEGTVEDIAVLNNGRKAFVINSDAGDDNVVAEEASNLVATGWLRTGEIRFGTFEDKIIRFMDILALGTGTIDVEHRVDNVTAFTTMLSGLTPGDISERLTNEEATRFEYEIQLNRDSVDATAGPTLLEYRLRAEPLATGRFRYFVPIMVYDSIQTNSGVVGGLGYASAKLKTLMTLYRSKGQIVLFQQPNSNMPDGPTPVNVIVEDLRFQSYTPPDNNRGFGGICLVVLREQE